MPRSILSPDAGKNSSSKTITFSNVASPLDSPPSPSNEGAARHSENVSRRFSLSSMQFGAARKVSAPAHFKASVDPVNTTTHRFHAMTPILSPSIGQVILAKTNSVAFFIELMTPTSPHSPSMLSFATKSAFVSPSRSAHASSIPQGKRASLTPILGVDPIEMATQVNEKLFAASVRRSSTLQQKKYYLRRRFDTIRQRVSIKDQRDKLALLKLKVKTDYSISSAHLKRQIILQQKIERWGSVVEHAQNVALVNRLRKCLLLRRSYSETFSDFLNTVTNSDPPEEGVEDDARSTSSGYVAEESHHFETVEHEDETKTLSPLSSAATSPVTLHPLRRAQSHQDLLGASIQIDPQVEFKALFTTVAPPITRFTLRELDLDEIITNVQLRHDTLFDTDTLYQVNVAGEKGLLKEAASKRFWESVEKDIAQHETNLAMAAATSSSQPSSSTKRSIQATRILALINEIKEIMLELLPFNKEFTKELESQIDIEFLGQQLDQGVLDVENLINYLTVTLKTHCAPARDKMVDSIMTKYKEVNLAAALETVFKVLETMKLDLANHHLNSLRHYFKENAVQFEWEFISSQIESGMLLLHNTKAWLQYQIEMINQKELAKTENATTAPTAATTTATAATLSVTPKKSSIDVYLCGVLDLVIVPGWLQPDMLPESFNMDRMRLLKCKNDFQDIAILAALLMLFRQASGPQCSANDMKEMKKVLWILLNDSDTDMKHVTLQIADTAGKIRGKPFTDKEQELLTTLTDKTLAPQSKVYELIQNRIRGHMESFLIKKGGPKAFDQELINKHGLTDLVPEMQTLSEKVLLITEYNRAVWHKVYVELIKAIKEHLGLSSDPTDESLTSNLTPNATSADLNEQPNVNTVQLDPKKPEESYSKPTHPST